MEFERVHLLVLASRWLWYKLHARRIRSSIHLLRNIQPRRAQAQHGAVHRAASPAQRYQMLTTSYDVIRLATCAQLVGVQIIAKCLCTYRLPLRRFRSKLRPVYETVRHCHRGAARPQTRQTFHLSTLKVTEYSKWVVTSATRINVCHHLRLWLLLDGYEYAVYHTECRFEATHSEGQTRSLRRLATRESK